MVRCFLCLGTPALRLVYRTLASLVLPQVGYVDDSGLWSLPADAASAPSQPLPAELMAWQGVTTRSGWHTQTTVIVLGMPRLTREWLSSNVPDAVLHPFAPWHTPCRLHGYVRAVTALGFLVWAEATEPERHLLRKGVESGDPNSEAAAAVRV